MTAKHTGEVARFGAADGACPAPESQHAPEVAADLADEVLVNGRAVTRFAHPILRDVILWDEY